MRPTSPNLIKATLRLENALDELEQSIIDRDVIQKRIDLTWSGLSRTLKTLDRPWTPADQVSFQKKCKKLTTLQKSLRRAQAACAEARHRFHGARDSYDQARDALAGRFAGLSEDLDRLNRCQGALGRTLDHAFNRLKSEARSAAGQTRPTYQVRDGAYDYIAFDIPDFMSLLTRLDQLLADDPDYAVGGGRYRPVSFLEIGCGPGRNLVIARDSQLVSWSELSGFDINPDEIDLGRRAFGLETELSVADAMTFDCVAFDVIYSFRPFSDNAMQAELEAHIARTMRRGAYFLAPQAFDLSLCHDLAPVPAAPNIWKKKL